MTIQDNPYDVIFDIESTDIKNNGAIMEVAAIRVHRATGQIVGRYYSSAPIPSNCNKCPEGEMHYKKVKDKCVNSLPPEVVFPEFLDWMRGPRNLTPPRLLGYCIADRDLPNLIKQLGAEKEWIAVAEVLDIAHEYAFKLYPSPKNDPNAWSRSLSNVAKDLGVIVDETRLHDPLYDCELCSRILPLLKIKMNEQKAMDPKQTTMENLFIENKVPAAEAVKNTDTLSNIESGNVVKEPVETLKKAPWSNAYGNKGAGKKKPLISITYEEAEKVARAFGWRPNGELPPDKTELTPIPCPNNDGGMFRVKINKTVPAGSVDHWFFACNKFGDEGINCKCSCNIDGSKGSPDGGRYIAKQYIPLRRMILKWLGYEPDC